MLLLVLLASLATLTAPALATPDSLPIPVVPFAQASHHPHTTANGLPSDDVSAIATGNSGALVALTAAGAAILDGEQWHPAPEISKDEFKPDTLTPAEAAALETLLGQEPVVRGLARHGGEVAVAAESGLYLLQEAGWSLAMPHEGAVRWAPVDVRAVAYDSDDRLWFAAPQGVGYRIGTDDWRLYTGNEGLPFNDFTCIAVGPAGVWLGTTNGAIHYRDGSFSFRQGRRWLLDNHIRAIAVDRNGDPWLATAAGVSHIAHPLTTLAEKATHYEAAIEQHHRRTEFGYVNVARLDAPGDLTGATPHYSDNEGHRMGLYLGAVSLGYAATGDPRLREQAVNAFRALAFLAEVTQGGTHPAPEGFIARTIEPTTAPDPNPLFDLEYDLRRNERDALWKIIQPRWPIDETGEWYWKNDSSSDELDGHFFGYAIYYDRVCKTEAEREEVRAVVRPIIDHLITHGFNLVDFDGTPTRWGRFSPDDMNRNPAWIDERGLNSLSMLTYLIIAEHITGDPKYREPYLELALDHGYGMNGMTQPTYIPGPYRAGHQPDDTMAFMNYYHLLRYEDDPTLLSMYKYALYHHWQYEQIEHNPFHTFVYAACALGRVRTDHWGSTELSPAMHRLEEAIDTLRRYPLDLVDWPMSNAHRIDMRPLAHPPGEAPRQGGRLNGEVFPIDERPEVYWDRCHWALAYTTNGRTLRDGVHYLLAYYMGLYHGFLTE